MSQETHDLAAVEIAKLEGRMNEGFSDLSGQMNSILVELRSERAARETAWKEIARRVEKVEVEAEKQDVRLRTQEARKTVAPWQLWTGITAVAGIGIAGIALFI